MRNVRLSRLLAREEVAEIVSSLGAGANMPLGIYNETGELISGQAVEGAAEFPVILDGDVIGVVSGDRRAAAVARLLTYLAGEERDKLDLAREVMKRHREITLFLDYADRMGPDLNPEELRKIVDREARKLFQEHEVSVSLEPEGEAAKARVKAPSPAEVPAAKVASKSAKSAAKAQQGAGKDDKQGQDDDSVARDEQLLAALLEARVAAPIERARSRGLVRAVLRTMEELHSLNDLDAILDAILFEARKLANADAGSIFLLEDKETLRFSQVHNETLFKRSTVNAAAFTSYTVPVSEMSIVGFAAKTGQTVVIDDAYRLPRNLPYTFNSSFDKRTGYRTTSILAIPLKSFEEKLVGVMQIINARDNQGVVGPFSPESLIYIPLLANNAAAAIERGQATRETVLRLVRLTALRDQAETEAHAQRVGAYAAEIFRRWAADRAMDPDATRRFLDRLRIAAMLHDLGKIGLPDSALRKKGRNGSGSQDYQCHTIQAARLFANSSVPLDVLCRDIALHHHERWDGKGFPGHVDLDDPDARPGTPLQGEEIPLPARIVNVALAYENMTRPAPHGQGLEPREVLRAVKAEAGKRFDPAVTLAFFKCFRVLKALNRTIAE